MVNSQDLILSFELDACSNTSGGIFSGETLIKTLWSNKKYPAGVNHFVYDGEGEFKTLLENGTYDFKVLSNNIETEWLGVIGNTSDFSLPDNKFNGLEQPKKFHIKGDRCYYIVGYNELEASLFYFNINEYSEGMYRKRYSTYNFQLHAHNLCSDNQYVYMAGLAAVINAQNANVGTSTFIFAVRLTDFSIVNFEFGQSNTSDQYPRFKQGYSHKVIDRLDDTTSQVEMDGITVQQTGTYLINTRSKNNRITVLNKNTGALITTVTSYLNCRHCWLEDDTTLWLAHDVNNATVIEKFTISSNPDFSMASANVTITGVADPIHLRTSNGKLLVTDRNDNRIKEFSTTDASLLQTVGSSTGYDQDENVQNDKFLFEYGSAVYDSNENILICDDGNNRWLKYSKANSSSPYTYANIFGMQQPRNYICEIDKNINTHIYSGYFVFEILNYDNPTNPANWKLIKNWEKIIPTIYKGSDTTIKSPITVNNRLYCILNYQPGGNIKKGVLVELVSGSTINPLYTFNDYVLKINIMHDLSMRYYTDVNATAGTVINVTEVPVTGHDANGYPLYGTVQTIASVTKRTALDPDNNGTLQGRNPWEQTLDGKFWTFNTNGTFSGFHLGAFKPMLNQEFVIKTLPSTFTEYTGPFPLDGNFDTGNGTNAYAGGTLSILKEHVFCNHKGEFWKGGQTNMFYHYHQSGLLLNIFGTTFPNSGSGINYDNPYQIGMAGNTFCIRTLQHKNHILLFTNDESYHGGVHIWKISRIEDFKMQYGKVKLLKNNGKVFLTPYTSSNFNPLKKVKGDFYVDNLNLNFTGNVFDILPAESTAFVFESFNITFPTAETYTIYIQTEAGFKLYMNDVSLIDQLNNDTLNEFSISTGLVGANTSKKIKIEYKGYKNAVFKMQWSSATISKQVIPLQYLFSLKPVNDFEKINLLEGLKRNEYISEYCGWKLTPQSPDLSKVYLKSGINTLTGEDIRFNYNVNNSYLEKTTVIREIGKLAQKKWQIDFEISFFNTSGSSGTYYIYLELKDINDKTLFKIEKVHATTRKIRLNNIDFDEIPAAYLYFFDVELTGTPKGLIVKSKKYGFQDSLSYFESGVLWNSIHSVKITAQNLSVGSPSNNQTIMLRKLQLKLY